MLTTHLAGGGGMKEGELCHWCRYAALSGAARARRGAKGRRARDRLLATLIAEEASVGFADEDGDSILLKRNANGSVDYFANGVLKVRALTHLRASGVGDGVELHIEGEAAGPWPAAWEASVPEVHADVVQRAVMLFEEARRDAAMLSDSSSESGSPPRSPAGGQSPKERFCRCKLAAVEANRIEDWKGKAVALPFGSRVFVWLAPYCQWCAAS